MGDADASNIYRILGSMEQSLKDFERRVGEIEHKQDKSDEILADVRHMRNNIAMMKAPVEDYKRLKERGTGAYVLLVTICGAIATGSSIVAYIIRAYVLGLGTP